MSEANPSSTHVSELIRLITYFLMRNKHKFSIPPAIGELLVECRSELRQYYYALETEAEYVQVGELVKVPDGLGVERLHAQWNAHTSKLPSNIALYVKCTEEQAPAPGHVIGCDCRVCEYWREAHVRVASKSTPERASHIEMTLAYLDLALVSCAANADEQARAHLETARGYLTARMTSAREALYEDLFPSCTDCPHVVGDSDERDCCFPECCGMVFDDPLHQQNTVGKEVNVLVSGCSRSHPHENMPQGCQRSTEIAREQFKLIRAMQTKSATTLAEQFHDTYEKLAPQYGYTTREDTRQFDPGSPNGQLMVAVCAHILASGSLGPVEGVSTQGAEDTRLGAHNALPQKSTTSDREASTCGGYDCTSLFEKIEQLAAELNETREAKDAADQKIHQLTEALEAANKNLDGKVSYDVVAYDESWGGYGDNASKEGFTSEEEALAYVKGLREHLLKNAAIWKRIYPVEIPVRSEKLYPKPNPPSQA